MAEREIVGVPGHAQNLSDHRTERQAEIPGAPGVGVRIAPARQVTRRRRVCFGTVAIMEPDRQREAVLRTFLDSDGRLLGMPAKMSKRRFVLEHVVCAFEPGVKYAELEVNAILRSFYDDYAALRRYLIDAGLMAREDGFYWRTGGYVVV
jgi:hypothetical protein